MKKSTHRLIFATLILALFQFRTSAASDDCLKWFKNSGVSRDNKDCVIECDILPKDMATFACADRCDEFCKSKSCLLDTYWQGKIKNGRPEKWDLPTEVSTQWSSAERQRLLELLSRLPNNLKSVPFDGFYRMKKSVILTNPGTTATTGDKISIYDRAFGNPFFSTSQVVVHEFGHVLYRHLRESERQSYRDSLKWKIGPEGTESRPGNFVSPRSKDGPDEDFAENVYFFLFEPAKLKSTVPPAYEWISGKFSKNFKLKKDCKDEKK